MKTKREMTLAQALEEIDSATQEIKSRGAAVVDGREFNLDEPVTLEIESEAGKKKAELEFEIKFTPAGQSEAREEKRAPRRGRRRLGLIIGAASAAAIATALIVSRRRGRGEDEEDEGGD